MVVYFKNLRCKIAVSLGLMSLIFSCAHAATWKFGVISDTQWTLTKDDGYSPDTVAAGIIKQVDQEFIRQGVEFVIAVGDTVDVSTANSLKTRALYAQDLYNAGIGFYPIRGNHEAKWVPSGTEFAQLFPQIRNGVNNKTPVFPPGIGIDTYITPVARAGYAFTLGTNFSSPKLILNCISMPGFSYSFDYQNARMVLLDQWDDTGNTMNSTLAQQQKWIADQISDTTRPQHVFVFGHKNLLGGYHKDNLFGDHTGNDPGDADPCQQPEQDAFISSLAQNNVRYYIGGHDHHHSYSIIKSPLSKASVHQIISASDSSKFYTPMLPVSNNETPVSQDFNKIGYYVYTINGPHVTVNYYGVPVSVDPNGDINKTPILTGRWMKLETFGYSLNGREFLIAQGQAYSCIQDSITAGNGFVGTHMKILSGTNCSVAKTNYGKALTKAVNTGWTNPKDANGTLKSDILSIWGMSGVGSDMTDAYVISLSFAPAGLTTEQLSNGKVFLSSKAANGTWVNAVSTNFGGTKNFVLGAYDSRYGIGTYGVNMADNTVWAVVNHDGDFAVIVKSR